MKWEIVAFALILLPCASFAIDCSGAGAEISDSYSSVCTITPNSPWSQAMPFIAAAFTLVSLLIALAYMHAKLREDARSEVWAKDEAKNLAITVLLFAGLLVFFTGACSVAAGYTGGDPFESSKSYINHLLQENGNSVLRSLTYGSIADQKEATKYIYVGAVPFFGSGVASHANMRAHSANKELIIDIYLPILASLTAQLYILDAIQMVGASLLLPFAFVMRLIPFTREFGNILIAVFFGIYIVAPMLYAMSGGVFECNVLAGTPSKANFYSYGLDGTDSGSVQEMVLYKVGSTIPQAVFLPNIVLIVTITCIMSLSKALRAMAV